MTEDHARPLDARMSFQTLVAFSLIVCACSAADDLPERRGSTGASAADDDPGTAAEHGAPGSTPPETHHPGADELPEVEPPRAGSSSDEQTYPQNIVFDWPEDVGGQTCRAGRYAGEFSGDYFWSFGDFGGFGAGFPLPIVGQIDMTLVESQDGEFFEVTDGKIEGLTNGYVPFTVDIVGRLDCSAGLFVDGLLLNGVYNYAGQDYHYEGTIAAGYDRLTSAFVGGVWEVAEPGIPGNGGSGVWGAQWVP